VFGSIRTETHVEIVYDVFLPDAKFRKSDPGPPAVCLCIARLELALIYTETTLL